MKRYKNVTYKDNGIEFTETIRPGQEEEAFFYMLRDNNCPVIKIEHYWIKS